MKNSRLLSILCLAIVAVMAVFWIKNRQANDQPSVRTEASSTNAANATAQSGAPGESIPHGVSPSNPPATAALTNLLPQLEAIKSMPASSLVADLTAQNERQLLAAYQSAPLSNRTALVWTLAGIGGDETAKAFIHTLREEFAGKQLVADEGGSLGNEEAVMQAIANALGLVASRSEIANNFVRQAIQPTFWQETVKWQSSTGKEINGLLTSSTIQGLGMTDRADIPQLLLQLKDSLPTDTTVPSRLRRSFAGDVVQAEYYLNQRTQLGNAAFYKWFLDLERDTFDADGSYRKWTATSGGAEWKQWYLNQIK
jgi:hypothetical protein